MAKQRYFPGASEYFILEGEARFNLEHFGSEDPLALERINFKENVLNELIVRMDYADRKIELLFQSKEQYELCKKEIFSGEVSLECSIDDDALQNNVLEVAHLIIEFLVMLRGIIPGTYGHLFRRVKKVLSIAEERVKHEYAQSRIFLFPQLDEKNGSGKVADTHFHTVAKRLELKAEPIIPFRDKVLAHIYDKQRFVTHLTYEQYSEIINEVKEILDAVAIVGTLSFNDWCVNRLKKPPEKKSHLS